MCTFRGKGDKEVGGPVKEEKRGLLLMYIMPHTGGAAVYMLVVAGLLDDSLKTNYCGPRRMYTHKEALGCRRARVWTASRRFWGNE